MRFDVAKLRIHWKIISRLLNGRFNFRFKRNIEFTHFLKSEVYAPTELWCSQVVRRLQRLDFNKQLKRELYVSRCKKLVRGGHSYLSAINGSTFVALRPGM